MYLIALYITVWERDDLLEKDRGKPLALLKH